jgi:tight adherence protein B
MDYFSDQSVGLMEFAIFGLAVVVALIFFIAVFMLTDGGRRNFERRLKGTRERAIGGIMTSDDSGDAGGAVKRENETSLDQFARRFLPNPDQLRQRLLRTGKNISIGKFGASIVVVWLVSAFLLKMIIGLPLLIAILAGVGLGLWLPHFSIGWMIKRRQNQFINRFPEAIDVITRGLRAGLPIAESIINAKTEVPEPISGIFGEISDEMSLGVNLEEALAKAAGRLDVPEVKFFAVCLAVQRETGGNLAETLANLSEILRKRRQMKLKIKAMSSEARASAYILGSLPFIMFGLIYFVNPGYAGRLFTDIRGNFMVAGGLTSIGIGVFIMWKMVSFEI